MGRKDAFGRNGRCDAIGVSRARFHGVSAGNITLQDIEFHLDGPRQALMALWHKEAGSKAKAMTTGSALPRLHM